MLDQNEGECGGVEVRPAEKRSETGVEGALTGPRLFSELGTGITTLEVMIPPGRVSDDEAEEGAVESEDGKAPSPPCLVTLIIVAKLSGSMMVLLAAHS